MSIHEDIGKAEQEAAELERVEHELLLQLQ